jgi:hypothetical protein
MGQAVAKVLSPAGAFRGTAFAISRDLALTAFHCIGDRVSGKISLPKVSLKFLDGTTRTASFHSGDHRLDFALLKLKSSLPNALEPIPIATEVEPGESFRCMGFPVAVRGPKYVTIGGKVRDPAGSLFEGVPAIQLYSEEAAASAALELPGMSGAPVLVGRNPEVVVGIIRWNPQRPDGTAQAQGGMVFACPIKNVLEELPALEVHAVRRVHHEAPWNIDKTITRLPESFLSLLSEAALTRPVLKPQFSDLFEIIRNSKDVPAAVFRIDPSSGLAPYDVPYVEGRESALYEALLGSGGTLLVQSRGGLGKTREVAKLAARLCDEGWTVCVAKGAGDAHLDAPDAFPDDLRSSRVLFVLDDLHLRVSVGTTVQRPYSERLNAFLEFFGRMMTRGEIRVIATARTEPYYQRRLGFDPSQPLWGRFNVYELPEFTLDGLQRMLVTLADQVGVQLDKGQTAEMVSKSDQTPRTIVENVKRSYQTGDSLTLDRWLPSQGRTWEVRFQEAIGNYPEVEKIYQALHLIREIGVPTRVAYVINLGTKRMSEKFSHTVYASLFSINRIIPKYTHASSLSGRNS